MSYIGAKPAEQILSSADIQDGAISTVDLADASITQAKLASGVAGSGPAFYAYKTGTQTLTTNVYAKIIFAGEIFDTNNNFASSTFTPTVAGYYQINACCYYYSNTTNSRASTQIYKNGSSYSYGQYLTGLTTSDFMLTASTLVYCNGTTDYIEVYGVVTSGGTIGIDAGFQVTYFNGSLVRAA